MSANPIPPQIQSTSRLNADQLNNRVTGATVGPQVYYQSRTAQGQGIPQVQQIPRGPITQTVQATGSRITGNQQSRPVIVSQPVGPGVVIPGQTVSAVGTSRIVDRKIVQPTVTENVGPKPPASSRIEYIPYQRTYTDYETKQVVTSMWVPVQRKCLNYYAIENITEYLPREIEDIKYELVPEETINYRVQYVPIEKKIVHIPKDEDDFQYDVKRSQYPGVIKQNGGIGLPSRPNVIDTNNVVRYPYAGASTDIYNLSIPGYVPLETNRNKSSSSSRTNYVTTDGYVPNFNTPIPEPPMNLSGPTKPVDNNFGTSNVEFLNNKNFLQGLSKGIEQLHQGQGQQGQQGATFMNNSDFMNRLSDGFGKMGSRQSMNRTDSRESQPKNTRITERQSFSSQNDYNGF